MTINEAEKITKKYFSFVGEKENYSHIISLPLDSGKLADVIEAFQTDEMGDDISRAFDLLIRIKEMLRKGQLICSSVN